MTNEKIKILNEANFKDHIEKGVTMVDFWAGWCGPCRAQSPILDQIAEKIQDEHVSICKVNVDENQKIAQEYEVMSIPTIVLFKDGKVSKQLVGLQEEEILEKAINEIK